MKEEELKTLKDLVNRFKQKTENDMKRILSQSGKGNSRLIKLINIKVNYKNEGINMNMNLPDYAKFVDSGRRPGKQPPLKNIQEWCKRKSIDAKAAFPIARKIGKTGLPATNFLSPWKNFQEMMKEYKPKLFAEMIDKLRNELKNNKKK